MPPGEREGNPLRVRYAPPVDAAANEALVLLLAEALDLPRRSVELVRGHTSRHKTLRLHGLSAEADEDWVGLSRALSQHSPF